MAATAYELLAFGLFAAVTLGSSLGVVLVRDVWHAALFLGVALLSVAVHFIILQAEFLAARSDAILAITRAFDANGITIPFPIRTLDFGIVGGERLEDVLARRSSVSAAASPE